MPRIYKVFLIFLLYLLYSNSLAFSEAIVYMKSGEKIKGRYIGILEDSLAVDIGLGGPLVLGRSDIEHVEYINDLGIKLACPSGWYMYTKNSLKEIFPSQQKESIARWAVAFYEYPYRSVKNNPLISLEIQPIKNIESPREMAETTIAYIKKVTKNLKLVQPPQEIVVNNLQGIKYMLEYSAFGVPVSPQLIYIFYKENFLAQITFSMDSSEFVKHKKAIDMSINSFTFTNGKWPRPSESALYKVMQGGVISYVNGETSYTLILNRKENLSKGLYMEIEFPNPISPKTPIVASKEISGEEKDTDFYFSSPAVKGIEAFKRYSITVNTYKTKSKKELIDTLSQEIISFASANE